jgi:hypothetical protein
VKMLFRLTIAAIALGLLAACATPAPAPTLAPPTAAPAGATLAINPPRLAETRTAETRVAESAPTITTMPAQIGPRRPRGIYAELHMELVIAQQKKTNPAITEAELHTFFRNFYDNLLANPSLSGLAVGLTWNLLNPNPPSSSQPFDWSLMDDAFASVDSWNVANPTKVPKTIQVQISAGFGTPQWVLDQIPSCDKLFESPPQTPPSNCGKATFNGFFEGGGGVLPMPWNAFYKSSFKMFLTAFAARYGTNPAFVSMDVSGPTAASTEMILPNNINTPNQSQFGNIAPNEMWLRLLTFAYPGKPAYQKSDQAFIDEWNTAIDMFGGIFSGVTLVATTGDGLFDFGNTGFTIPAAFKDDCPTPSMDCAAETTILSHFIDPAVARTDAKATQESGMKGRGTGGGNLDAAAARRLSQRTAQFTSPAEQILAGEQFATSAALFPVEEGCTSIFPPKPKVGTSLSINPSSIPVADIPQECLAPGITQKDLVGYKQFSEVPAKDLISPEQAMYNVLRLFFDGTPAASSFGGASGATLYNYVQIYNQDIMYASTHVSAPARVVMSNGTSEMMTAQDLLNLASQKLFEIAEPKRVP